MRLFSPKTYFNEVGNGKSSIFLNKTECLFRTGDGSCLSFPYQENNLPMMLMPDMVQQNRLFHLDLSGETILSHTCVAFDININITAPQKELLGWSWKLAHIGMRWVQTLMLPRRSRSKIKPTGLGIILTKHAST